MNRGTGAEFCTVVEAARLLNVSAITIWRWIDAKKLPAYRVGPRTIRIRKDDLEGMIRPARAKEVTMGKERIQIEPATEEELARRKVLVAQIVARRRERVIAPLTSVDLVRKSREEETDSYGG